MMPLKLGLVARASILAALALQRRGGLLLSFHWITLPSFSNDSILVLISGYRHPHGTRFDTALRAARQGSPSAEEHPARLRLGFASLVRCAIQQAKIVVGFTAYHYTSPGYPGCKQPQIEAIPGVWSLAEDIRIE